MNGRFPTDGTIRQYLLGQLDDQADLENTLSEQMLFDDGLSEIVDAHEDEIIDDYLDGTLNAADKKAFKEYFLQPRERREKLRFAGLLRRQIKGTSAETRGDVLPGPGSNVVDHGLGNLPVHWRSHFRTYCELATLALLVILGSVYLARIHQDMKAASQVQKELESKLAQERERSAALDNQLRQSPAPVVRLTFFASFRDVNDIQQVEIKPSTQRINVEIRLQDASQRTYDVRLEDPIGQTIWLQKGLKPSSSDLYFELPREVLKAAHYSLFVSPEPSGRAREYRFQARITQ